MVKPRAHSALDLPLARLVSLVYFVQGALGLAAIAFPLFLRQKGWSISEIAAFSFVSGIPWTLKVVYGAISDAVSIGGLHRKPYVIGASALSFLAWLGLALIPHPDFALYAWALLGNLGFALTDVVTDAMIVEHSTGESTQVYQSLAWGFRSVGAVASGFLGGWLAKNFPYSIVFALTALLPLTTLVACFFIEEPARRGERGGGPGKILGVVWQSLICLFRGDLAWFSALLLVGSFSASFGTPFFFYLKEKLGFAEEFLGLLSSVTWLGAIAGCLFYGRWLKDQSVKKMLVWSFCLNAVSVLSAYGIVNRTSAVAISLVGGILGYVSLLPLMAAAAILSRREGIEGSLFALLMSVYNLGQILSGLIGGKLFDIIGLKPLIALSAGVGLVGLIFVIRLKNPEIAAKNV